ncbi:FAD-dependent oxidoreductase [Amycolatopsis pithecellobii]|uniref:FAD-dependent oxidoreductase n=1 Tax=Amycolatopsis pithecellobii TaxID=664692 RepID=A0A6N7YQY9_9PSEU|nr:FAD-dependent oxidoreductase [Amycolatopsis pithecellobii]MTD54402.1 FAD-dependent oxidoreductase [Amycolatopsis pithecellobii]
MNAAAQTLPAKEFDVVVAGSGAAALTAAGMAARAGASVALLEAGTKIGGNTAKSSGGFWVPRNRRMRERGQTDERFTESRDGALAHMAKLSYPELYRRGAERHGLPQDLWDLNVFYYDHVAEVFQDLEDSGDLPMRMNFSMRGDELGLPTWFETEEDGAPYGRLLCPRPFRDRELPFPVVDYATDSGEVLEEARVEFLKEYGIGYDLACHLLVMAVKYGVTVALEHRVTEVVLDDDGAAIGVVAETPDGPVTVQARQGVVFGTGGMEFNPELRKRFLRGPIVGTCGVPTNRGDFVAIGERLGVALHNMEEAWWTELPVELCAESFEQGRLIETLHGDSMVLVNAAGERVVNEKESYNERGKAHLVKDASGGFPNRVLIQVFDDSVLQDDTLWATRWPVPMPDEPRPSYLISGDTLEELASVISRRLASLSGHTGGFALEPSFVDGLKSTIEKFNEYARAGEDPDFQRGTTLPQRYFSLDARPDPMPNHTMYPFADRGPYHAILLGASCLGTKGGPKINVDGQIVREDGTPIPRLYGAGNCIGSPAGAGYWGGGVTLGLAITYGYHAGHNVVREPRRAATPAQAAL